MSERRATADAFPEIVPASAPGQLALLHARVQQLIASHDDSDTLVAAICQALCACPGVLHAALFRFEQGDLCLDAQHGERELDLPQLLQAGERLLQSPLRDSFPALQAAAGGAIARFDTDGPDAASASAAGTALAQALRAYGADGALGLPVPSHHADVQRGAVSLLFERNCPLTQARSSELSALAQLIGIGLRLADVCREMQQLRTRATQAATVDALTGVASRRHGEGLLEQEVRRARRYNMPLALLAFDIDRFQEVNDHFGLPVGDMALRTVATTAQALLRSSDMLVRSGGEEFQVIVPHTIALDGLKLAEKLRQVIANTDIPGCDHVTVSFGVAQLEGTETGDALTRRANAALARAKRAGRNRVELAR
jgi:diguanylate cyclase (GGDEF)-like protein